MDIMKEHGKTIIDMLSVELTEAEKQQLFEENGFEKGYEKGHGDDLLRSMRDAEFQEKLFEKFGI